MDVGHGNCAVARDGKDAIIIDIPAGTRLANALVENDCTQVRHLVLSHADNDHIGGATQLLSDKSIKVDKIWINPDVVKESETYKDLLILAQERQRQGLLRYSANLNESATGDLDFQRIRVEVVHPSIVRSGFVQSSRKDSVDDMTSNGMSAVLRILLDGHPSVLLPGDVDDQGFRELLASQLDILADVFVFPHHGGRANSSDDEEFARLFCESVKPRMVVFSMARSRFENPRPEIVRGARRGAPHAHIACTQLSKVCHQEALRSPGIERANSALDRWPSAGEKNNSCCVGTLVLSMQDGVVTYSPDRAKHVEFIKQKVASPQCIQG